MRWGDDRTDIQPVPHNNYISIEVELRIGQVDGVIAERVFDTVDRNECGEQ